MAQGEHAEAERAFREDLRRSEFESAWNDADNRPRVGDL